MVKRPAFTMIELIFAIVIISIAVLSLPMMNQITSKNLEGGIVQEAIFAASAELNQVVSYSWDEDSTEAGMSLSRVVWSGTDCNSTTKLKSGHISQLYHRRCTDANTSIRLALGSDGVNDPFGLDDLDDINTTTHSIFLDVGSATGYKNTYDSNLSVSYSAFGTILAGDQNIKKITVTVSDSTTNEPITVLSTFSSNIGEVDYYKRTY